MIASTWLKGDRKYPMPWPQYPCNSFHWLVVEEKIHLKEMTTRQNNNYKKHITLSI